MSHRDADFSHKVKQIIASRAGYRCSFPGCDESTIGPGVGATDIERKGVAAHIFAASEGAGAPRGTGGLSAADRSKAANGIWLCHDHSWLTDYEKGRNYPASTLQAWKALQESRIARELKKTSVSQIYWIERVTLEANPLFENGTFFELGKVTLIIGKNGLGKSALCEWISGCGGYASDLWRWGKTKAEFGINLRMQLQTPNPVEFSMKFSSYALNAEYAGKRALDLSHAIRVLYLQDRQERRKFEDDLEYLARVWRIHFHQVFGIINQIASSKYGFIKSAEFRPEELLEDEELEEIPEEIKRMRDGRSPLVLWIMVGDHEHPISFTMLSGSEKGQVLISGAMIVANHYSAYQGAILLLDLGWNFSDQLLSAYAERLQSSDFGFQTILVAHSERPKVNWTGWSVAKLIKDSDKKVRFEQNTINSQ